MLDPVQLREFLVFARVPRAAVDASRPLWTLVRVERDEVLFRQGDPADTIGLVAGGVLAVSVDGVETGRVLRGELVGEVSTFGETPARSATLTALEACAAYVLPRESLPSLREAHTMVYDALLDDALAVTSRRITRTNDRLARLAEGTHERPIRRDPSALARLWRKWVPGTPSGSCPPLQPFLRALPGLAHADAGVLTVIAAAFEPRAFAVGEVLLHEQEPADSAWILVEGSIDVLRQLRGTRAERLTGLEPGDLFGVNALISAGPRTASCVAATKGWAWRLHIASSRALEGATARAWKECMLACMNAQLRLATGHLSRALGAAPSPPTEPEAPDPILAPSGHLERLPANLGTSREYLDASYDRDR